MQYASTFTHDGTERVVVLLPLSAVPGFDPANPPQENTYVVNDNVQIGWVKINGEFVAPPPTVPTVPAAVTRRQFKSALHLAGLLDTVDGIVAASGDRLLQINWQEALDFERANPFVAQMAVALGKTSEEVDQMFITAKSL